METVRAVCNNIDFAKIVKIETTRLLSSGSCYDGISPTVVIAVALENIANECKLGCMNNVTNRDDYITLLEI